VNILTISLINSCNRKCSYCPIKKWLVPLKKWLSWDYCLNNKDLLKWTEKQINPDKWFIELTGGEPGLYPEIDDLIEELTKLGFYGIVKTNGTINIKRTKNFQLITAWHYGVENIPAYYDKIVIIKNPQDKWRQKVRFCKENKIPYKTTLFDPINEGARINEVFCNINKTINSIHVNSSGQITACAAAKINKDITIFNENSSVPMKNLVSTCLRCKNINDIEVWLPDDIRAKFVADFDECYKEQREMRNEKSGN